MAALSPRRFSLVASAIFLLFVTFQPCHSEEEADTPADLPDFEKMKAKELKALLTERGVECKGCAEKADLVKKVQDTYHLPVKEVEEEPEAKKDPLSDDELQEMLKKLGKEFGNGFKVMTPDDIKKMKDDL
eukprot:CAMPEP_0117674418 /NCGR_PEP_ID=MMETSP0804-20121206/15028_1 /TAXON_ID=1074897 /ORGANISM="Tetraselmis astigmatica, Strain CCMP880" /LENGTH=130 /DNA_ID=CAMNT_0005483287 /DNA_START=240 /DNA_END=632 /DNA_ORIENTATION=+